MKSFVVFHRKWLKHRGCSVGSFGNVPWVSSRGRLLLRFIYFLRIVTHVECWQGTSGSILSFAKKKFCRLADGKSHSNYLWDRDNLSFSNNFLSFHIDEHEGCLLSWDPPATIVVSSVASTLHFHWERPLLEVLSSWFQWLLPTPNKQHVT